MIENEQGKLVRFRLRPAQELLFRTVVPEHHPQGASARILTAIDIYLLDEALFNKNLKVRDHRPGPDGCWRDFRTKI